MRRFSGLLSLGALLLLPAAQAGEDVPPSVVARAGDATVQINLVTDSGRVVDRSGVVVDSTGLVLTSARSLTCHDTLMVVLPTSLALEGEVLVLNDETDVALVRIKPKRRHRPGEVSVGQTPKVGPSLWAWGAASKLRSGSLLSHSGSELTLGMTSRARDVGGPVFDEDGGLVGLLRESVGGRSLATDSSSLQDVLRLADADPVSRRILCSPRRKVWGQLAEAADYYDAGNFAYALTVLQQALSRIEPGALEQRLWLRRAGMFLDLKRFDEAVDDFTLLLQIRPMHREALLGRAEARVAMRDWKRGLEDLDLAASRYPDDLRIQGRRAAPLRALGRPAEAHDALRQWIATGRASPDELGLRCRLTIELGALTQAGRACTAAHEAGWDSGPAFAQLSAACLEKGDFEGAVEALDLAVDAGVTDPVVLYNRAVLRLHLNRPAEALADLESLLGQVPDHGDGWHLKALALAKQRKRGEAIGAARRAAELGADGAAELLQYLQDGGLIDEVKLF